MCKLVFVIVFYLEVHRKCQSMHGLVDRAADTIACIWLLSSTQSSWLVSTWASALALRSNSTNFTTRQYRVLKKTQPWCIRKPSVEDAGSEDAVVLTHGELKSRAPGVPHPQANEFVMCTQRVTWHSYITLSRVGGNFPVAKLQIHRNCTYRT